MTDITKTSSGQDGSRKLSALPAQSGDGDPVADLVRQMNGSHPVLRDLWARVRRAADTALRSLDAALKADEIAEAKRVQHHVVQAEQPRRQAPRPRQWMIAGAAIALDAVACYFAAQALNGDQIVTLIWTGFFLAVLAGGEILLDIYCDRSARIWRVICLALCGFVAGLGVLRYSYLFVTGNGLLAALIGATLFTAITGAFLLAGYRALRAAETADAWRARRESRKASRQAEAAHEDADRDMADFERLADTYIAEARHLLLDAFSTSEQPAAEAALRAHLLGRS